MVSIPTVVCFGEVLWDIGPKGVFLGGAPCNVAYHLHVLGSRSLMVSAVGADLLGYEVKRRLAEWRMESEFVGTAEGLPTGTVKVDLSDPSNPSYDIVDNVAWDAISDTPTLHKEARQARCIIFGSLALRHRANRLVLNALIDDTTAFKCFDVNLRAPYYDVDQIIDLGMKADLIKVNAGELLLLHPGPFESVQSRATSFSRSLGGISVCVTCGSLGAGYWDGMVWTWSDARPIPPGGDAVGAGDAFLAGLIHKLVLGATVAEALNAACRLAELVASSDGATPSYDPSLLASG